jgi:hypothetical protein
MYIILTPIGPHVYGSWHITKPKKNEKKNIRVYNAFIAQEVQTNTCFEWIFNQNF